MTTFLTAIYKILDSLLDRDVLEEMVNKGEFPKYSIRKKTPDFWFIYFDLLELSVRKVEMELERRLNNNEILFMADKIERFLKVSLVS